MGEIVAIPSGHSDSVASSGGGETPNNAFNYEMIVLNPKWLNSDIIGRLLLLMFTNNNNKSSCENGGKSNDSHNGTLMSPTCFTPAQLMGIFSIDEFQEEFPDVDALDLLQLLESLSICIQNDAQRGTDIEYEFPCFNYGGDLDSLLDQFHFQENCLYHGVIYQCDSVVQCGTILTSIFPRIQTHFRSELHKHAHYDADELQNGFKFSHFEWQGMVAIVLVNSCAETIEVRLSGGRGVNRKDCFYFLQEVLRIVEGTIAACLPGICILKSYFSPEGLKRQKENIPVYQASTLMSAILKTQGPGALKSVVTSTDGSCQERIGDILCFGITDLSELSLRQNMAKVVHNPGKTSSTIAPSPSVPLSPNGEPTLANRLHSSNLSLITKQRLCQLLDPPEDIGRDWCMLGILLGMTDKLPKLDPINSQSTNIPNVSPTARVLEECARNAECTIKMLVDKLTELNRFDAVDVILNTGPLLKIFPLTSLPEEGVVYNDESSHTSLGVSTLSHTSSSNLSR